MRLRLSRLIIGVGLVAAVGFVGFLVGARVGFEQGKAQARLAVQEVRVRQVLFALGALADGDDGDVRDRLENLLAAYIEDRAALYDQEPFWLARDPDDVFPSTEYIPGQLDAMLGRHLTDPSFGMIGVGPLLRPDRLDVLARARADYLDRREQILTHVAGLYGGAAFKSPVRGQEFLRLHERVDGPIAHEVAFSSDPPTIALQFLGDAQIGEGGVLWARYRVPSGEAGYLEVNVTTMYPNIPWWRRWLAILPFY